MKNYGKGFIKTILLLVWAIGVTWLMSRSGNQPFSDEIFGIGVLFIMVCVISVSHYTHKKE